MIIMFIFLGLTIVFIIGTAIYLNKSKKQNGFTQNIDKKENQGKKVDKKKLENIFNFKYKFIFLKLVVAYTRVFYNKKDMALFLNKNHIFSKYFIYILRIKHIIENSICYSKQYRCNYSIEKSM